MTVIDWWNGPFPLAFIFALRLLLLTWSIDRINYCLSCLLIGWPFSWLWHTHTHAHIPLRPLSKIKRRFWCVYPERKVNARVLRSLDHCKHFLTHNISFFCLRSEVSRCLQTKPTLRGHIYTFIDLHAQGQVFQSKRKNFRGQSSCRWIIWTCWMQIDCQVHLQILHEDSEII